jgi:hypothetical protein
LGEKADQKDIEKAHLAIVRGNEEVFVMIRNIK